MERMIISNDTYMINIFDINTVMFTIMGYPMSYVEFMGTVFNILCVWLTAKGKISSWPIGIVGIIFYIFLFYQIQLYADLFEQFYFFLASFYGWWMWAQYKEQGRVRDVQKLHITKNGTKNNILYGLIIACGTVCVWYITKNITAYFPTIFPEPASYPFLDAFTTVVSFVAMILMAQKKVACWYLWIIVDVIGIWLYFVKGVRFISLEYFLFLILATQGLLRWRREVRDHEKSKKDARIDLGQIRSVA